MMCPDDPKIKEMLRTIGVGSVNELFSDIPREVRIERLNLPDGKCELDVKKEIEEILKKNKTTDDIISFLGAGIYDHFIPSAVFSIIGRSEFYTSYTPYQAEASQGMLQALFEYQSLMAELTGMDAINSSMYDGATALGEAALMCARLSHKSEFIFPRTIHWEKKSVLDNYSKGCGLKLKEVGYNAENGKIDLEHLKELVNEDTAGVYIENPNFFGVLEDEIDKVKEIIGNVLFVVGVNPISLGIVKAPGDYGADIVVGDAQPLGNPMNFGGPLLGIFGCRKKWIRSMPGRVIGLTKDADGKRAFCMTLQTREQHIRRSKATSNICSNESLCAVATAVYLSLIGRDGLRKLAAINISKAQELAQRIDGIDGFKAPLFNAHHFNEFVVSSSLDMDVVDEHLREHGIQGGIRLNEHFEELKNTALYCTTETHVAKAHDALIKALEESA